MTVLLEDLDLEAFGAITADVTGDDHADEIDAWDMVNHLSALMIANHIKLVTFLSAASDRNRSGGNQDDR